jgi:hypothetical protein
MIRSRRVWMLFSMLFGLEGILTGQVILEYPLGASHTAATRAPASRAVKAIRGVTGSLDKVVKKGQETVDSGSPSASRETGTAGTAPVEWTSVAVPDFTPAVPARIYEDPRGIRAGMAREELLRRFGPPALEVMGASSGRTLTYSGKSGTVQLEVRDETVALVSGMSREQATVILPLR